MTKRRTTAAEAIWQALTAMAGSRSIEEITDFIERQYPNRWVDLRTSLADLVWQGNESSGYRPEQQFLERTELGVYRIRQSGRFAVGTVRNGDSGNGASD